MSGATACVLLCDRRLASPKRECGAEVTILNVSVVMVGYCLACDAVHIRCPCGGKLARPYHQEQTLKCMACAEEIPIIDMHLYQLELFKCSSR